MAVFQRGQPAPDIGGGGVPDILFCKSLIQEGRELFEVVPI